MHEARSWKTIAFTLLAVIGIAYPTSYAALSLAGDYVSDGWRMCGSLNEHCDWTPVGCQGKEATACVLSVLYAPCIALDRRYWHTRKLRVYEPTQIGDRLKYRNRSRPFTYAEAVFQMP